MSNALRRLLRNLGSLILALLLAVAVWIAATLQSDPFELRKFPNVPITLINQPDDAIFFEPIEERVAVTARAPESVLAELKASDFEATMDLSEVQPGTPTSVPIEVTSSNEAVRIEDWDPTEQTVYLEAVGTITMPVTMDVEGQVTTGYQASRPVVVPDQVVVHGPELLLIQVASVTGSVDVEGAREDVVEEVRVTPLDAEGELVPGLQWTPDSVEVRVSVRRRLGYKPDVEVVPDLRGDPAPGYRLGSVAVEPSTVTLAGVPSVLEELPGFVETWPISVTGATEDLFEYSPLTVPNSVVVVGVDYVTVTVEVLPIQSSRAMTATVEIQGVRPGWIATPSPSVVDAILEGPDTVLAEMTSDDLRVVLDLFGYGLGVHRVEPKVFAPEGVAVVSIIPETIEVVIVAAPTPTPTLTVTPTMTIEP
jgi:YbbR domain-containing protein